MTERYSQGKPRSKAQQARYYANNPTNGYATTSQIAAKHAELFPGLSEYDRDNLSTERMAKDCDREIKRREEIARRDGAGDATRNREPKAEKTPSGDRFMTLRLFWERGTTEGKLELSEIAVWLRIWEVEGREGHGYASISFAQLERETRTCRRTIERAMANLRTRHMVKTVRKGNMKGDVSHYVISPYPNRKILDDKDAEYARNSHESERMKRLPTGRMVSKSEAHDAPIPDWKEEGLPSSSFQVPGPVRPGPSVEAAGPVLPGQQTNSDGGTIPLSPPSTSMDAINEIAKLDAQIAKALAEIEDLKAPLASLAPAYRPLRQRTIDDKQIKLDALIASRELIKHPKTNVESIPLPTKENRS